MAMKNYRIYIDARYFLRAQYTSSHRAKDYFFVNQKQRCISARQIKKEALKTG